MNTTIESTNKRIAKNTLMLYMRMLLMTVITLYTSRIVLSELGIEDYGIFNVVGGIVTMLSFLSTSMALSTQRFITFGLGSGDKEKLHEVFVTCIQAHICLAIIIVIIAETFGLWFLYEQMNIPHERLSAAFWVYQCSIIVTLVVFISVPYNACIIAHEHMNVFAIISLIEASLKLGIAFLLPLMGSDKLISYAVLLVFAQLIIRILYGQYTKRKFEETNGKYIFDKKLFKEIISFAGWSIIGNLAGSLSSQGTNILLNIYFGPVVNAAKGIATQVQGAINGFAQNFQTALNPQITKTYAIGSLSQHLKLVTASSKFSSLILLVMVVPLIVETDYILKVWLTNVPDYTVAFVRLALIISVFDGTTNALVISAQATGKLKWYQICCGMTLMAIVPVSYVVLKFYDNPNIVYFIQLIFIGLTQCVRLLFIRHFVGLNIRRYLFAVYPRLLICILMSILLPMYLSSLMEQGISRLLTVGGVSIIWTIAIVYLIGLSPHERLMTSNMIIQYIKKKLR